MMRQLKGRAGDGLNHRWPVTRRCRIAGLVTVLGGLLLVAGGRAETLTVATYNVENYVSTGRRIDGVYYRNYPKTEVAKTALRAVIRALDADVLALQEMGPRPYLEELRHDLRAEGIDYPYAAMGNAADADRHTAVLSRRPLRRVSCHPELDFPYHGGRERVKRGLLEVTLREDSGELTLFVVHLKSRLPGPEDDPASAARRAGEAKAIRDLILKRFPRPDRARFLIAGDLNAAPDSRPLRLLTRRGHTRIAQALPAADPRGDTWTYVYRRGGSYERMDYILVSPGLRAAVDGAAIVFDGPGVRKASDHRPVRVRIKLPVATKN